MADLLPGTDGEMWNVFEKGKASNTAAPHPLPPPSTSPVALVTGLTSLLKAKELGWIAVRTGRETRITTPTFHGKTSPKPPSPVPSQHWPCVFCSISA